MTNGLSNFQPPKDPKGKPVGSSNTKKLKAPSTAEFSGTTATGGGPWTVTGQVDSQNSFGAMIRSPFGCTVTITGESARVRVEYIGD
jgi:hypothetical protein